MAKRKKTTAKRAGARPRKKKPALPKFFLGLRTAVYFVEDLDKAKTWYNQVLGFPPYFDSPFYVGFNVGGFELGLHPRDEKYPGVAGSTAAYWGVAKGREAYARLLELGASEYSPLEDVGGGILIGTVKDPFGNVLGIIENPAFKIT